MSTMTNNKTLARENALQVLFQVGFHENFSADTSLNYFKDQFHLNEQTYSYSKVLVNGILDNLQDIDDKIQSSSENWKITRMALVDLNVLRIATYELTFLNNDVPPKVVIDEAIEMAKKYSTTDSASFINGILDNLL